MKVPYWSTISDSISEWFLNVYSLPIELRYVVVGSLHGCIDLPIEAAWPQIQAEPEVHLREQLRSIVMSASVCVFICPRGYLRNHTNDLYQIFVHVAYVHGSVLLRHVDDRPHRLSAGRGGRSAQRGRSVVYDCLVKIRMTDFVVRLYRLLTTMWHVDVAFLCPTERYIVTKQVRGTWCTTCFM